MKRRARLARFHIGRPWIRDDGFQARVALLPAPDLMRRGEEGRYTLAALYVTADFYSPWGDLSVNPRHLFQSFGGLPPELKGWRWPLRLAFHSDAAEIAFRRAEGAGHRFPGRCQPGAPLLPVRF